MNKHWNFVALLFTLGVITCSIASAQGPGFGGPPPPMSAAAQAKMEAWRKWRDSHRHVGQIGRTVRAMIRIESNPKTKLNHAQAQSVLGVLKSWRSKSKMTDAQAVKVEAQMTAKLNKTQLAALTASMARWRGMGGPGGPGGPPGPPPPGGRPPHGGPPPGGGHGGWGGPPPGGPPPGGGHGGWGGPPPGAGHGGWGGPGGPGGFDPAKMPSPHDYNPLNPSTLPIPPMRGRAQQDLDTLTKMLKAS